MKKFMLITMAIIIFIMPLSIEHQKVEAAPVLSKVINGAAKKVAKEVITDTTVQMSMNMVIDYKYTPKDGRKPKAGDSYSFICMPRDKKPDGNCAKPMEIKKSMTEGDKVRIKLEGERVLEKKIAGGVTATKWGKFLDWFLPIFSVGMGVAVIDYAMSGEVSDLFDEIAYDVLVNTGLLTPAQPTLNPEPEPLPSNPTVPDNPTPTDPTVPTPEIPMLRDPNNVLNFVEVRVQYGYKQPFKTIVEMRLRPQFKGYVGTLSNSNLRYVGTTWQTLFEFSNSSPVKNITFGTRQSHVWIEILKFDEPLDLKPNKTALTILAMTGGLELLKYYPNETDIPVEAPPVPKFDELNMPRTTPAGTPVKIPAPGSVPFEKVDTGEQLIPFLKPDGTIGFKTRTGIEILDPDKIQAKDPVITLNPDGSKKVKKQPTGEVPNPSPNEDGKIPPKTDTDPPPTDPDTGESCERLKKPDFKPLSSAITTSFPFSIPWDLHRAFTSAFSDIGDSRPEFSYKFDFNGKNYDWKIGLPQFFDSWMPFVRGLLLLGFDIGLVYAIYRFTRGGE